MKRTKNKTESLSQSLTLVDYFIAGPLQRLTKRTGGVGPDIVIFSDVMYTIYNSKRNKIVMVLMVNGPNLHKHKSPLLSACTDLIVQYIYFLPM